MFKNKAVFKRLDDQLSRLIKTQALKAEVI